LKTFGSLGLTGEEMAALLGVDGATISHRMNEPQSDFLKSYKTGLSNLKKSLRRKQIAVALKGNTGMLIWLGKQLLDQHDTPTTAVNVAYSNPHAPAIPTREEMAARLAAAREFLKEHPEAFESESLNRFGSTNGD
jgi:hypothetical protein